MGSALSCISDPNREQGAYTLSKEHPGRAEAIAEYKARKNSGYQAKKAKEAAAAAAAAKDAQNTAVDAADDAADDAKKAAEEVVEERKLPVKEEDKPQLTDEGTAVEDPVSAEEPVADETEKTAADVLAVAKEEAAEEVKAEEPVEDEKMPDGDDVETKIDDEVAVIDEEKPDETGAVEDVVATPVAPLPDRDETEATKVEEPEEGDTAEEPTAADEEPAEPLMEDGIMARASSEAQINPPKGLIDARRAMFENTPDNIPEAKEIKYDVLDPVTGEHVSLPEYRERQRERMQGVVKEHTTKYEELDEKALKEVETTKLQNETRKREVRSWTKPDSSSAPSSPTEPRKLNELELPQ